MKNVTRYRIRVGKIYFDAPHYVVALLPNEGATVKPVTHPSQAKSWETRVKAKVELQSILLDYPSAEIEAYFVS